MTKWDIRAEMRAEERKFLQTPGAAGIASAAIIEAVEAAAEFQRANTVLCYMSIPGEVETHDAIERWYKAGKRVVLPLVSGDALVLKEYGPDKLQPGYRGIMEPCPEARTVPAGAIDLAIIPGVAFTLDGSRMGRGKGFYDRLLPRLSCPKFGVCYPFRMLPDLPTDPWDAPLDAVITAPAHVPVNSLEPEPETENPQVPTACAVTSPDEIPNANE